jgi:exodeoxyribonuclease-5
MDPDTKGKSSAARRWRSMSAAAKQELKSQGTFFSAPEADNVPVSTAKDASSSLTVIESPNDPNLTPDQAEALGRIEAACKPGESYLLTGHAGSGKTYLMQRLTLNMQAKSRRVILTAPTHKAVAVLARKLAEAEIKGVPCRTIHSVLSLTPKPNTDRMVFSRDGDAEPVLADVVVIDECSMVSADLYRNIKRHLPDAFVLFVGDPAQLPPVGEVASETFSIENRSHLTTIVRQAAGNPILAAASIIRASQGGQADLSWCVSSSNEDRHGIFLPAEAAQCWMKKAFTSAEFEADPDSFRYLAWTNARVRQVNERIRRWRYGEDIPTPFMPGESALFRAPVIVDDAVVFANNQEAKVLGIERSTLSHKFEEAKGLAKWTATIPTWLIRLRDTDGEEKTVHMAADEGEFQKVIARIRDEAVESRIRWMHLHEFQQSVAKLQSIYSLTVHTAQGGTFGSVFLDLTDIRRRERTNLLEAQQMMYVAVTRPLQRLIVVE